MTASIAYTRTARLLHWATALLLLGSLGIGVSMTRWVAEEQRLRVYAWHEWVGVTIFGLTIVRFVWRLGHPPPPLALPSVERAAASAVHALIYVILVVQPLVGWVMSTAFGFPVVYLGLVPLPQPVDADRELALLLQWWHDWIAIALVALVTAHVGGVLYHHLFRRDGVLRRMLP